MCGFAFPAFDAITMPGSVANKLERMGCSNYRRPLTTAGSYLMPIPYATFATSRFCSAAYPHTLVKGNASLPRR